MHSRYLLTHLYNRARFQPGLVILLSQCLSIYSFFPISQFAFFAEMFINTAFQPDYFSYLVCKYYSMLRSMTGYGRSECAINDRIFIVELRSLNGKQFELLLKMPSLLKPFEFELRNFLAENLTRGSVECTISMKQNGSAKSVNNTGYLL